METTTAPDHIAVQGYTLTIRHEQNRLKQPITRVYDEEGDELFSIWGHHDSSLIGQIAEIRHAAFKAGQEAGRAGLQSDLKRLLNF